MIKKNIPMPKKQLKEFLTKQTCTFPAAAAGTGMAEFQ
jgi:hypothetical protein